MAKFQKFLSRPTWAKVIGLLLAMTLILASAPQPAMAVSGVAATDAACKETYTVKSGDYLVKIADAHDVDWRDLAEANDLEAPYVVFVGMKMCIPAKSGSGSGSSGGTTSGSSGKASFTAVKSQNSLVISTSSFPTKSSYYVKVDDARNNRLEWHKIGTLRTGNETAVKVTLKLPDELRNSNSFLVCLKNVYSDAQICNNPNYNRASTKSGSSDSDSKATWKGTFTVDIVGKSVEIETSKFPTNSFFFVRVDNASVKALEWHRIGIVSIRKNADVSQTFSLPEALENASRITVCLKNIVNDTVSCHVATR